MMKRNCLLLYWEDETDNILSFRDFKSITFVNVEEEPSTGNRRYNIIRSSDIRNSIEE